MTSVGELLIASPAEPWRRIGLPVRDDTAQVGGVRLRFVPGTGGVVGWGLVGLPEPCELIDGLPTHELPELQVPVQSTGQSTGILGFDHLVVMTSSLERTCGEIERATGEPLKRIREAGAIRQGFHRLGEVIVEVVESSQISEPTARFWGFVWNVADIHEWCDRLGPDVVSLPKPAVQPGRFIATFRESVGLSVPLGIMSAPSPRASHP